jgi:hypothetical protein
MLDVSVARADLTGEYNRWINEGLREIQRDYNYSCMRHVSEISMAAGSSSARMPDDFKQLQIEKGSVSLVDPTGGKIPVSIKTRERLICQAQMPNRSTTPDAFLSNDGDTAFLNLLDATTTALTFSIAYFRYLPELDADDDENYITREFTGMVKARIKAIAFGEINDPLESAELAKYEIAKASAKVFDTLQRTQGRTLQMGG